MNFEEKWNTIFTFEKDQSNNVLNKDKDLITICEK